jgi:arsenate reductase
MKGPLNGKSRVDNSDDNLDTGKFHKTDYAIIPAAFAPDFPRLVMVTAFTVSLISGAVMSITIYHNPACGTSRHTLAMIRQSGEEPEVVEYLKTPPSRERLVELFALMGIPVRALLRQKGTPFAELGLDDPRWSDDELIDFMIAHPILINRPIVVTPLGAKLCRPSELVLDILANANIGPFTKDDGEVVIDADGRRVAGQK